MTRDEQLQAAAQIDVVAKHRKAFNQRIKDLMNKLSNEIETAMRYEKFLKDNPYYKDKDICDNNLRYLEEVWRDNALIPAFLTHGDESEHGYWEAAN